MQLAVSKDEEKQFGGVFQLHLWKRTGALGCGPQEALDPPDQRVVGNIFA